MRRGETWGVRRSAHVSAGGNVFRSALPFVVFGDGTMVRAGVEALELAVRALCRHTEVAASHSIYADKRAA